MNKHLMHGKVTCKTMRKTEKENSGFNLGLSAFVLGKWGVIYMGKAKAKQLWANDRRADTWPWLHSPSQPAQAQK